MLPADLSITRENNAEGGGWTARTAEGPDSHMTYRRRADGAWIITHTGVPESLEGRGIARALLDKALEDARAEGARIEPRCSYVRIAFERHPEWSDLLAD